MGPGAVPETGRNEKPSECYIFIMQFRMELSCREAFVSEGGGFSGFACKS